MRKVTLSHGAIQPERVISSNGTDDARRLETDVDPSPVTRTFTRCPQACIASVAGSKCTVTSSSATVTRA